jgi:ribosome-associated translation inhibitor RaiA
MEVSPSLEKSVKDKLGKLEKFFPTGHPASKKQQSVDCRKRCL